MPGFAIEHLTHELLLDAWPIIRSSGAYARADWWLTDAACLIDRAGGLARGSRSGCKPDNLAQPWIGTIRQMPLPMAIVMFKPGQKAGIVVIDVQTA